MKKLLTFSFLIFFCLPVFATHLKGGEIQVSPVQGKPFTYEFTVTLYCDLNAGLRAWADQKDVLICLGDGMSKSAIRVNGNGQGEDIGNGIAKGVYKIIYTYNNAAISYRVSVVIPMRNASISNLPSSEQYPFYIETLFNPNILNSTPVLTNDLANANAKAKQKFTYNSKVIDADGDSLAYRLIVVRSGDNANCTQGGRTIDNFKQPNEIKKEGTFKVDSRTGDLIWNSPTEIGVYSCAFVVEEWRKGIKISETVRDMEINVKDGDGITTPIPPYEPAGNLTTTGLALGNEGEYEDQNFVVYPNPTIAKFMAKITTDKPEKAVFQLFDILGKVVEEHFQNNFSQEHIQEFNLQNATEGIFFIKVQSGNQTLTKKVVKR
jgi:hypothetical protein